MRRNRLMGALVLTAVLCTLFASQLIVSVARGQSGATIIAADDPGRGWFVVTSNKDVYYALYPPNGSGAHWSRMGTIPSSSPIISIHAAEDTYVHAFAANGNFYVSADLGQTWQVMGNVLGAPTSDVDATWGTLKARYR